MPISHPSEISGLAGLWLADEIAPQQDDTDLSVWPDTSGNARHMTQDTASMMPHYRTGAGPRGINGWPCVEFMGGQILNLPNFLTGFAAGDIFIVLAVDADPPTNQNLTGIWWMGVDGLSQRSHHPWTDGQIYNDFGTSSRKSCGNPAQDLRQLHIAEFWSAANDWGCRINGNNLFTTSSNTVAWPTTPQLGGATSHSWRMDGRVVAMVLFDRKLGDAERADMEGWLGRYFSSPNQPPEKPEITNVDGITDTEAVLHGSPYSDPENDPHEASHWQVDRGTGDFSSPVFDSGEDASNLTSIRVSGLSQGAEYKARVRYKGGGVFSDWSDPVNFSTLSAVGFREFWADFKSGIEILSGVSIDRRPDAVSLDYLTAFAPGPVALGDNSQGLVARVWRVRADSSRVYYSRGAQSSWEKEKILFTYSGPPIVEIDAAFEQNGRFVVAAERHTGLNGAPEIWIYWFDPQLGGGQGGFVFQNFGAGRTPRVVLDNPLDSANSDVQVFYISDSDDAVVHRQQRDRYGNVILTPMTGASNLFLEEVAFTKDKRVLVLASRRNPTTGRYTLEKMYSKLPLQIQAGESMGLGASLVDAGLKEILKRYSASIEALGLGGSVPFVAAESIAVLVGAETEEMGLGGFPASVGLAEVVVFPAAQPEALGLGGRAASAALAVAVIRQDTLEQLDIGASVVAASLTQ